MDGSLVAMIILLLVVAAIMGGSALAIWLQRNHNLSNSEACPIPPQLSKVTAVKQIWDQTHWMYRVQQYNAYFQLYCPTTQYDVNVFISDKLAMRSNGKFVTVTTTTHILDCHGNIKYTTRTGNAFQTFINGNGIFVSFELRLGGTNGEIVGYAEEKNFFSNDVQIKDIHGNLVTEMHRNLVTVSPYSWEYDIHNLTHPAGDILLLMTISGKISFSDSHNSKGQQTADICNNWFWTASYMSIIILGGIAVVFLIGVYYIGVHTEHKIADYLRYHSTNIDWSCSGFKSCCGGIFRCCQRDAGVTPRYDPNDLHQFI